MLIRFIFISIFLSLTSLQVIAQSKLTSDEAFELLQELRLKAVDINSAPELYFNNYFQRMELLPIIKNKQEFVFLRYYHISYQFRYLKLYKEAIKNYKRFFEFSENNKKQLVANKEFRLKQIMAYGFLADCYTKTNQVDMAKNQHELLVDFVKSDTTIYRPSTLNNYGLFYYNAKKERDTAFMYFQEAYKLCKPKFPNHHLIGSIRDNIADIYVDQNQFKKAKELYKENFSFYRQGFYDNIVDVKRLVSAGCQLVETTIKLDQQIEAKRYFSELEILINDPIYRLKYNATAYLEFLRTSVLFHEHLNNTVKAFAVSKELSHLSDSISNTNNNRSQNQKSIINDLTVSKMQKSYALEKQHKEDKIAQQKLRLWILTILSLSFLGFLSSLFLRRRQRIINAKDKQQLAEQELKLTTLRNNQLRSDIKSKKRDLSDFAINLTQNQEWAKVLSLKFEELKDTKGRQRKKMLDSFETEIKSKVAFDIETKDFFQRLDKLSDTFYSQLNSRFPNLTKTEKRLCSLIRLKIDSHQIATLQNITLSSLNTSRYRLRKKINLSKDDDLDAFIQSL